MKRKFECVDGGTSKFWHVEVSGSNVVVHFGRIGTSGQSKSTPSSSPAEAKKTMASLIASKVKKGYSETGSGQKAKAAAPERAAKPVALAGKYPFLFLGEGFGTSRNCLEGCIVFERPPTLLRPWIAAQLPLPVGDRPGFDGTVLAFASDDLLPQRVRATYNPAYAKMSYEAAVAKLEAESDDDATFPTKADWQAFCADFQRSLEKIHRKAPIVIAVKPDDGEFGKKLGAWHQWSVQNAHLFAERALKEKGKPSRRLSYMAINLIQDAVDNRKRLTPVARKTWAAWGERVAKDAPKELREDLANLCDELQS